MSDKRGICDIGGSFPRQVLATEFGGNIDPIRRKDSLVFSSFVSLDGTCPSSDEESTEDDVLTDLQIRVTKKRRILRKLVAFAEPSQSSKPVLGKKTMFLIQETPSIIEPPIDLYWSRSELRKIQVDGKFLQATDPMVQEYSDSFERLYDRVVLRSSTPLTEVHLTDDDEDVTMLLEGVMAGWRGLESFSAWEVCRRRQVRKIVRTIVSSQNVAEYPEMLSKLSIPFVTWAKMIGEADHQAAI